MLVEETDTPRGHPQSPETTLVGTTNISPPKEEEKREERETDPILRKKGCLCQFLACWSLSNNFKKLVVRQRPPSELDVLDGVRVLSIFWVIFGHAWFFMLITQPRNAAQVVIDQTR